jgi:hypothetical protein
MDSARSEEDLLGGTVEGFLPPHVRSFEVHVSRSDVYILGIQAPALTRNGLQSRMTSYKRRFMITTRIEPKFEAGPAVFESA